MEIEFKQNDELIKTELHIKQEDFISEHEIKWTLRSKEYEYIFITFEEGGGKLNTDIRIDKSPEIELNQEEIIGLLEGFIEKQVEIRKGGTEENEEDEEAQPYDYNKISIKMDRWSLSFVHEMIKDYKDIDLSPDFQRNYVWDTKRKSQLIESLMLKIPVPAFYLAETNDGKYQVVDGLQRLTTLNNFMNNEFPLKYLEYLKDDDKEKNQEGRYFRDEEKKKGISPEFKKNILKTQINVNIIESKSPTKVKFDVFRRVNTGGKPLNNQEIRNCLANNKTRELLNELAQSESFKKATNNSVRTTRMQAQELVLRYVGFWYERTLKDNEWRYSGNMTEFLDVGIELLNKREGKHNEQIKKNFERSMLNTYHLFGEYAFRKCLPKDLEPNARKQLINKSLFTTWSIKLSEYEPSLIQSKINEGEFIYVLANYLENNQEYFGTVSYKTNDKESLKIAFNAAEKLIQDLINS
jgi:hypothetical protein